MGVARTATPGDGRPGEVNKIKGKTNGNSKGKQGEVKQARERMERYKPFQI